MVVHAFDVPGDIGLANALRRTLLSDLEAWAPCSVLFRVNTSCQTDEFLSHRIGLIPFRRVGNGDDMTLKKTGGIVTARDVTGCAFEAVHPEIEIMDLGDSSSLDMTIHFDKRRASSHARYSTCAAVGMRQLSRDNHRITFELHDERMRAADVMLRAIDCLEGRVDRALLQLASQPNPPPRSRSG